MLVGLAINLVIWSAKSAILGIKLVVNCAKLITLGAKLAMSGAKVVILGDAWVTNLAVFHAKFTIWGAKHCKMPSD